MKKINFGFGFWLIVISFGIAGLAIWGFVAIQRADEKKISGETSREVALACTTDMATRFHIHPQLKIIILGKEEAIPANIGIKTFCMNSIHTHDASGVLHVESPIQKDFTVGDFFAVWNKPYSKDQILDYKVDDKYIVRETVNGKEIQDYDNTVLHDKDQIIISYEESNIEP